MRPMSVRFPKRTSILNAVQKRADCKQVSKGEKMETSEDKQENGPIGSAESTESEQLSDSPTRASDVPAHRRPERQGRAKWSPSAIANALRNA